MKTEEVLLTSVTATLIVVVALLFLPVMIPNRVAPGLVLDALAIGGVSERDFSEVVSRYEEDFLNRKITVVLGDQQQEYSLRDLGVTIDMQRTSERVAAASRATAWFKLYDVPVSVVLDEDKALATLHADVAPQLNLPKNATLQVGNAGGPIVLGSAPGEQIDVLALEQTILARVATQKYNEPIPLTVISAAASVQDSEVARAEALTNQLLNSGFIINFEDKQYEMKPFTIRRLVMFVPQTDPGNPDNEILGLEFNKEGLEEYLTTTIVPEVNQEAVNARFELESTPQPGETTRVRQFALPQRGQAVDIEGTVLGINQALASNGTQAQLAVAVTDPEVNDTTAIEQLGVTELIAQGSSDFVGSPRNRVHNIQVGASKYHGLLIAPGEEFSFNEHLGPVDASGGFKPELVIKQNVTVPEFGGGLCQVSTTAFRAALYAGLEVTERRNHSYAVAYYGTPGFDATIYPGHTDLRFLNNTPGYILIQTRIEGTKLLFDFWGTKDGRVVEIDGPNPYNRQSDGAVKATLTQVVRKGDTPIIEETFYSNYKSPKLFPKVLSANGEKPPEPNASPTPNPTPANPSPQNQNSAPTPSPAKATP